MCEPCHTSREKKKLGRTAPMEDTMARRFESPVITARRFLQPGINPPAASKQCLEVFVCSAPECIARRLLIALAAAPLRLTCC